MKVLLSEIFAKANNLFEGKLSDDDRLVYANHVKGRLLVSDILVQQTSKNSTGQFDTPRPGQRADRRHHRGLRCRYLDEQKGAERRARALRLAPAQSHEALRGFNERICVTNNRCQIKDCFIQSREQRVMR